MNEPIRNWIAFIPKIFKFAFGSILLLAVVLGCYVLFNQPPPIAHFVCFSAILLVVTAFHGTGFWGSLAMVGLIYFLVY